MDTSAFARALDGKHDHAADAVRAPLGKNAVRFPPIVITELMSTPLRSEGQQRLIALLPLIALREGFWYRAGQLRAELKGRGLKANVADVLIAQTCIDSDIPLITYDRDYRHFLAAGLQLA